MKLHQRVLWNRLRRTGVLVLLRLIGLTLAALLAAAVPVFVSASMEQTLQKQIAATPDALSVVLAWTAPDTDDHGAAIKQVDEYLRTTFPAAGGLAKVDVVEVPATGQRAVQMVGADGKLVAGKKYFALSVLPSGVNLASGRLPADGQAEVVLPDAALAKSGYKLGDKLRVPLTQDSSGQAVTVTLVGTVTLPETGPVADLKGVLDSAVMTSSAYWSSLATPAGAVTWAVALPAAAVHAARLTNLAAAVQELPLRAARLLPDIDVTATPASFLANFLAQMATNQRMLTVLLLPVYLLVVFFVLATADVVVSSRQLEVAVLRSRGARAWETLRFYLSESLLLAGAAALLGLVLTPVIVKVMGLSAGFLQLVDRPRLPVTLTWSAVAWSAGAAAVAELVSLVPLVRAARFTVATLGQDEARRSPAMAALRIAGEVALLVVLGYGSWRLFAAGGGGSDPLYLPLPALALVGAGVIIWRVLVLVLQLVNRLAGKRLSPPFYLALSLLRSKPGRYQALWLMLVVTTGLGIYGAAFARTLDRDLVARAQYQAGSDIRLLPVWEEEVLAYDSSGNPSEIAYQEPPYSDMQNLPGSIGSARVQTRKSITLAVGTKNLGKTDLLAIQPQEFGQVARFISELTPYQPVEYLNLMAKDEEAVLVSSSLAQRLSLRGGEGAAVVTSLYRQVLAVLGVTLGLAGLVGWLLSRWLATPLAQLGTATEAVAGGDFLQTVPAPGIAELDRVSEQFNRMVLRLRDSFQALALERDMARRFATDAAHELKTPVTTLRAYHEVLEEHPERASQVAPAVGRQIDRMERVIAGLLELARLGEGTGIHLEPGDAAAVLRDLEPAYRELVEESGHSLNVTGFDQALPVLLDRRLLEVAVTNLVDNACKYTAPGGNFSLLAERMGHDAVITVADTGKGIAPEELPYVFERFHRGVDTQTIPGTGLGLAMAQESVRRMGGELTAESTPGAGSRFSIRLPLL